MHENSMNMMREFAKKYVKPPCSVVDVGSFDVNGTYKGLFRGCTYEGIDIVPGPNVDRVVDPYFWGEKRYDVVISGNTMEHVRDLHKWTKEIIRVCKPGGLICIIAPHTIPEHRYPIDCWRVLPDGMKWIFGRTDVLECYTQDIDTYMVARTKQ